MRSSCVRAAVQERTPATCDRPSDRLRTLAREVRRIGVASRHDPERIAIAKDSIAHELVTLARRLDGGRHG
jgi:hypothetical protein